jgi:hypothetical protein
MTGLHRRLESTSSRPRIPIQTLQRLPLDHPGWDIEPQQMRCSNAHCRERLYDGTEQYENALPNDLDGDETSALAAPRCRDKLKRCRSLYTSYTDSTRELSCPGALFRHFLD